MEGINGYPFCSDAAIGLISSFSVPFKRESRSDIVLVCHVFDMDRIAVDHFATSDFDIWCSQSMVERAVTEQVKELV